MRISKLVQYISFASLAAFPWFVLVFTSGFDPVRLLVGSIAWWVVLGVGAALFHRNFEEGG